MMIDWIDIMPFETLLTTRIDDRYLPPRGNFRKLNFLQEWIQITQLLRGVGFGLKSKLACSKYIQAEMHFLWLDNTLEEQYYQSTEERMPRTWRNPVGKCIAHSENNTYSKILLTKEKVSRCQNYDGLLCIYDKNGITNLSRNIFN